MQLKFKSINSIELKLKNLIETIKPSDSEVACTIINMKDKQSFILNYYSTKYIYPASTIKIFICAEVMRQVEIGKIRLNQNILIEDINIVGDERAIFPRKNDKSNTKKTQTIDNLLKNMMAESDNTASNVLIDLVSRESINENIIHKYGWHGSEINRKFLAREKEKEKYKEAKMNMTCSLHLAECIYLIENNELISSYVSACIKNYMLQCLDANNISLLIPEMEQYYHKIGSFEINWKSYGIVYAIKNLLKGKIKIERWQNDVGLVVSKDCRYAICVLTHTKEFFPKTFPMKALSTQILYLLNEYNRE